MVKWDAHWGTCADSWGPLWTCAPASSRVVFPAEMGKEWGGKQLKFTSFEV